MLLRNMVTVVDYGLHLYVFFSFFLCCYCVIFCFFFYRHWWIKDNRK